jgi:hypothetical protein
MHFLDWGDLMMRSQFIALACFLIATVTLSLFWPANAKDENCAVESIYEDVRTLGRTCQALKDERDRLQKNRDQQTAMSSVDGMTANHMCRVLREVVNPQIDPKLCSGAVVAPAIVAAAKEFQVTIKLDADEQDGWLKTDQYVQLVCRGVAMQQPDSMRYAGWMFATGQGLPLDIGKAKFLLKAAYQNLNGRSANERAKYKATLENTDQLIKALDGKKGGDGKPIKTWDEGSFTDVCPNIDDMRKGATARRQSIRPPLLASVPSADFENVGLEGLDETGVAPGAPKPNE